MAGSRWVWARTTRRACRRSRQLPMVSSSSVSSTGRLPASTSGERAAVDADDVGVRDLVAAHPPVAVPLGPAVAQPHAVDHAVAGEPVVGAGVGRRLRVGPDAQQAAGQLGGHAAGDGQVGGGHLLGDGGEVAVEERLGGGGHGVAPVGGSGASWSDVVGTVGRGRSGGRPARRGRGRGWWTGPAAGRRRRDRRWRRGRRGGRGRRGRGRWPTARAARSLGPRRAAASRRPGRRRRGRRAGSNAANPWDW